MDAVILAGGLGTRLRSVVSDVPKPLAPIAGRPFLEILLANLASHGFTRVILSVGHLADKIIDHFGTHFQGMALHYVIEDSPLGTGGALVAALQHCTSDGAFIFNGDTFLDLEIPAIEAQWRAERAPIIVLREVPDTARYGRVDLEGQRVVAFREKGQAGAGMINAGCYVLPVDMLESWGERSPFSFEADFLVQAMGKRVFQGFVSRGLFIDIGIPEDYARAQTILTPWLN